MPLLACGFEAADLAFYERLGFLAPGATFGRRYVHHDADGFGGRFSMLAGGASDFQTPTVGPTARWFHVWFRRADGETTPVVFNFMAEGTSQFSVTVPSSGHVELRRGTGASLVLETSLTSLDLLQGHWLVVELVVDNVSGVCNVYVGDSGTPIVTYSGDTQQTNAVSYSGWSSVRIGNIGAPLHLDDLVITDATEGRVPEVYGLGAYAVSDVAVTFTPTGSSDSWRNVTLPGDGAYNSSSGSSAEDLYGTSASRLDLGEVNFVAVSASIASTLDHQGAIVLKSGATTAVGSFFGGASAYASRVDYFTQDPDTSAAWTTDAARAIQMGVRTQA